VAGALVLRRTRPDLRRPFRMWLYPLPAAVAFAGFLYVLFMRKNFLREIRYALVILLLGMLLYILRAWRAREWPFNQPRA
jgi:amino acid transporter